MVTNKVHPERRSVDVVESCSLPSRRELLTPSAFSTGDPQSGMSFSSSRGILHCVTNFFVPSRITLSKRAKRVQLWKTAMLQLISVTILLGENVYLLIETLADVNTHRWIVAETDVNIAYGSLIQSLQNERAIATLHDVTVLQNNTPVIEQLLRSAQAITNTSFVDVVAAAKAFPEFRVDIDYVWNTLLSHRRQKDRDHNLTSAFDEAIFYGDLIAYIFDSLPTYADVPDVDNMWTSLLSYVYLLYAKENSGRMRSAGIAFFGNGFLTRTQLEAFETYHSRSQTYLDIALSYSSMLRKAYFDRVNLSNQEAFRALQKIIRTNDLTAPNLDLAVEWTRVSQYSSELLWNLQLVIGPEIRHQSAAAAVSTLTVSLVLLLVGTLVGSLLTAVAAAMNEKTFDMAACVQLQAAKTEAQKRRTETLLHQMLPKRVARKLMLGKPVQPEFHEAVTVFFSDVVQFTLISSLMAPNALLNLLTCLFDSFDSVVDQYDVYKVETIGDAYVACSGAPRRNGCEHYWQIACMALDIRDLLSDKLTSEAPMPIRIRIGLHSGSVCAGVVGIKMPRYCLFGETVEIANKMESTGQPGRVHASEATYLGLTASACDEHERCVDKFDFELAQPVAIDGKALMPTYWLDRATSERQSYQHCQPIK